MNRIELATAADPRDVHGALTDVLSGDVASIA